MWKWVNYWFRRTKQNQIGQNFHSCDVMANLWENNGKWKRKTHVKISLKTDRHKLNMQKSSVQSYCLLLKPKTPKYREPNERNVKGSSRRINFHSNWGEETYLKAKECSKFRRRASLHDCMLKLILHAKAKAWVFANHFCSHFNAPASPIIPKVEFNFKVIMYIAIFVF